MKKEITDTFKEELAGDEGSVRKNKQERKTQADKYSHKQRRTLRVEVHIYYEKDRTTKEQTHSHWFGRLW